MIEVEIFNEIQTWLAGHFPASWIDLDFGQLEAEGQEFPLPKDSVFIDFSSTDWETGGNGHQMGESRITFRIALEVPEDSYFSSTSRQRAIDNMKRVGNYHLKLQGLNSPNFTPLERVRSVIEKRDNGRRVFALVYKTFITDNSAMPATGQTVMANPAPEHNSNISM